MNRYGYLDHQRALPSGRMRRIRRLILVAPLVLFLYLFVAGDSGFYQIWHRDQEIASLEEEIRSLAIENAILEGEVDLLTSDLNVIERIAREEYGMVRKNESVYMVYPHTPVPPARMLP